ncbi:MAG: carbohydrate ABC transporter substrate-binding protein [Oscillospiraceae bacterium]|nr:carbohydrate ABC transporter substrate-binding protein [Oscillospiraceae bacterium]
MSKLTRTLALLASIAVVSSAFVACGGGNETTSSSAAPAAENSSSAAPAEEGGDSSAAPAEEGGDSSAAEEGGNEEGGAEAGGELEAGAVNLPDTDDTLTIVCWTDADLANMFDVYANHSDANVVYQNCGDNGADAAVKYATYLNSGDDVDLFVAEAGWILNYINDNSMSAPLSDLGITTADYADAYQYTVEIGTDNDGVLKAASWQAAAGGYAYNTALAEEYLGVTSAEDMQAKISDWAGFEATAAELKEKSEGKVTMAATIGGLWQAFSTAKNAAWVDGTAIQTDVAKEFTDMVKGYVDNGYVNPKVEQWTTDWTNVGLQGETLGYFYSTWCLGEGAQLEQHGGTDGNWNIVVGPQEFFWGGSWLCVSPNCNTASEASKFVKAFTTDASIMEEYALYSGDFTNNKVAMDKIVADGSNSNPLLGGQDQFAVLSDVAAGIKMSDSITKYDQNLKDTFLDVLKKNIDSSTDDIISAFTTQALADNPDLTA